MKDSRTLHLEIAEAEAERARISAMILSSAVSAMSSGMGAHALFSLRKDDVEVREAEATRKRDALIAELARLERETTGE